ncbi:hypothetical protein [Marinitoga lauensis]|uniref:hypothetical protein n=1 Tax=Marinitoga lauensis TaxID=2201189 RepID=UPI00101370D1|nr:hypothetical protein [Marinitoga lauensis]
MITSIWQDPATKIFYFKNKISSDFKQQKRFFNLIFENTEIDKVQKILLKYRIKNYIDIDFEWKDIYGKRLINTTLDINYNLFKKITDELEKNNVYVYGKNIMNIFNEPISGKPEDKKIWFLDIEVNNEDVKNYSGKINSITYYDSYKKKYIFFLCIIKN